MSDFKMNNNIAQNNSAARERGGSIAREYERVVNTFNKVLEFKEKVRLLLETRSVDLHEALSVNTEKLNTLSRNIDIYDSNINKIANHLEEMLAEETIIKNKYTQLLQGASMEMVGVSTSDEVLSTESSSEGEHSNENLMQKRNHYIDGLNSSFHKLDEDLQSISFSRTEMLNARSEIFIKKEQALENKAFFLETERCLKEEINKIKADLNKSVSEEELLTHEYSQLINKVESCIVISEDIDNVLFSSLTAAME